MPSKRAGFTLIEIAVVLVILGLLVGGILGGRALLHASEVNRVLTDANVYRTASEQFKTQYEYLPGDFPFATKIWGRADGGADLSANCADPFNNASVGAPTCNGNGNFLIDKASTTSNEPFRFWQQLQAAGYISGLYTGIADSLFPNSNYSMMSTPGKNIPAGALSRSGYLVISDGVRAVDDADYYAGDYRNMMVFGTHAPGTWPYDGALTPGEAYQLDKKVDDGMPGLGVVRNFPKTFYDYFPRTCVDAGTGTSATYVRTEATATCAIIFTDDFTESRHKL
jgi:prepilin-type N-terminal cleavage/methylation domain-containing protein